MERPCELLQSMPIARPDPDMSIASHLPNNAGRFGDYGGRFVPETLMRALDELAAHYEAARGDQQFQAELRRLLRHYVGRPSPLYHAERLSRACRRRADLSQARRSQSHRRPQDQQHARPGTAHHAAWASAA